MKGKIEDGVELIEDPAEFKRAMSLYPLPKKVDFSVVDMS